MKYLAMIPTVLMLNACSTATESPVSYHKSSPGLESLQNSENCCETLSTIQYQSVTNPERTFVSITTASPRVEFKSGRSFAGGLKLPTTLDAIRFSVTSNANYSAFVPSLLVLDQNYQPLDVIGNETIKYQPLSLLDDAQYGAQIELQERYLNGEAPAYLVIFTTSEALAETTPVEKPSDMAIRSGDVQANIAHNTDYAIPHSAIGKITFDFDFTAITTVAEEQKRQNRVQQILPESTIAQSDLLTENTLIKKEVYKTLIENSVSSGDFSAALTYVEESERLGIEGMRNTFVDAMKQYQKAQ
ncbi:MalM family protein [Vibrio kagoshimensis]|uniref:MalM family protein n=1 Tax=Vibrio kagoshimensis TaxID=2910244 RepID=UPI003D1E0BFC